MTSPSQLQSIPDGARLPTSAVGDYNNIAFVVQQLLSRVQTLTLVKIVTCTNAGGISPVGFVDVLPLVNQLDGAGNPVPHVTIYNIPYSRLQGGSNAVIIDPEPGDIGICGFASRDISTIKTTKAQANPDTKRQFSYSDGLYLGGCLNAEPTQYIQFTGSGIKVFSPQNVTVEAPTVDVLASTQANVTAPAIRLGADGQTLREFVTSAFTTLFNSHTHPVTAIGSPTGTPNQTMGPSHLTTTVKGG